MTQQPSNGLDPVALWGAITGSVGTVAGLLAVALEVRRDRRDRADLDGAAELTWPEYKRNPATDFGEMGDEYVRVTVTNVGRRPVALRSAGLLIRFDDEVRSPLHRFLRRGPDRFGHIAFTPEGVDVYTLLSEGEPWVLDRKAADVHWDVLDQMRGRASVAGIYATTATGRETRWGPGSLRNLDMLNEDAPAEFENSAEALDGGPMDDNPQSPQ